MRIKKKGSRIELTNSISGTIVGAVGAIAIPILGATIVCDLINDGMSDINWLQLVECMMIALIYPLWFIRKFSQTVLRYKIEIDERGICEKRLLRKDRLIAWNELGEYDCETGDAPHRTSERYLQITFYSANEELFIRTWSFPESKQHEFRDVIFDLCDKYYTSR